MIVADTNLLVYFLVPSPMTALAQQVRAKDKVWVAPGLLRHELLNVLSLYVLQNLMTPDEALRSFRRGLTMVRLWTDDADPISVLRMAQQSKCTTYDLEYVWLAKYLDVPFVTADKEVLAAYSDVAVSVASFS